MYTFDAYKNYIIKNVQHNILNLSQLHIPFTVSK